MSCAQLPEAKKDFDDSFEAVFEEELSQEARAMLDWLFHNTIGRALCHPERPQEWNDTARIYVLPKLAELAVRIEAVAGTATWETILDRAEHVITKYNTPAVVVWCDGFTEAAEEFRASRRPQG